MLLALNTQTDQQKKVIEQTCALKQSSQESEQNDEQTDRQKTVIEQLCNQTDRSEQTDQQRKVIEQLCVLKQASQVSEQIKNLTNVYGMNGPGKTENSYDVEKLVVRERETWPSIMMVANVDKPGVGERKTKSSLNEQTIEQTIARIELDISNQQNKPKLQPGQQSVKSYFKVMDRQTKPKTCFRDGT